MTSGLDTFEPVEQLYADSVHVWSLALGSPPGPVAQMNFLSSDEIERAHRFRFEPARRRFMTCRSMLRGLLSRYLGEGPAAIRFDYGPHGKPSVRGSDLQFNLAHCRDLLVIALCRAAPVGVDVECIRPFPNAGHISRNFFSAAEHHALTAMSPPCDSAAFWRCWTRKEAYAKAIGSGLSVAFDSFAVSIDPAKTELLSINGSPRAAAVWSLYAWEPSAGFVAALAIRQTNCRLSYYGWSDTR